MCVGVCVGRERCCSDISSRSRAAADAIRNRVPISLCSSDEEWAGEEEQEQELQLPRLPPNFDIKCKLPTSAVHRMPRLIQLL